MGRRMQPRNEKFFTLQAEAGRAFALAADSDFCGLPALRRRPNWDSTESRRVPARTALYNGGCEWTR